nr:MAG TPA: hypothetical protein [Caudoviricetes sp.]
MLYIYVAFYECKDTDFFCIKKIYAEKICIK